MTPAEKLIVKHMCAKNFMYNTSEDNYYSRDAKNAVWISIQQGLIKELNDLWSLEKIKQKWNYLRDTFVRADGKVDKKESFTYYEKLIYERLYFLKPYIHHNDKDNAEVSNSKSNKSGMKNQVEKSNYERKNNVKVHESVAIATLNETQKYLLNVKQDTRCEVATILNDLIKNYSDKRTQISCLNHILKLITEFRETQKGK